MVVSRNRIKITIGAFFFTERDMDVQGKAHILKLNLAKVLRRPSQGYSFSKSLFGKNHFHYFTKSVGFELV